MGKNKQRRHEMESRFETHGDSSRCELLTNDVEKAKEFYRAIFGWQITQKLCPAWLASSRAGL
jgi:predicted enzyme related to lactoylglutathione lyase